MNLESVTAVLRPRGPWEATDFGARLIRRDAGAIYRIWFAVTLPLLLVSAAVTYWSPFPVLGVLLYWWLEPVADGPMLHLISRRLFGEATTARAAVRAAPVLMLRNWIFLLPPYRFHFARSIAMPLTQLEGLRGKARRERAVVVNRRIFRYGFGVTAAYQHLALALYIGVVLLVYVFVPTEYQGTAGSSWLGLFMSENGRGAQLAGLLVAYVAQTALEPWFVGAGFGLYVNCRTDLEAWDLEVAFRRMVQRRRRELAQAAAAIALIVAAMLHPGVADAQPPTEPPSADAAPAAAGFDSYWREEDLRPALDEVMASDELVGVRETTRWRPKRVTGPRESESPFTAFFSAIGRLVAVVFEVFVWALVAALVIWAAFMARKWLPALAPRAAAPPPPRIALADGEITAASLPADVSAAALERWRAGDARGALSLLYRGSVFNAVAKYGVRLPDSATEGMCLAAVVRQTDESHSGFFGEIVAAWTACAYGAQLPPADVVPKLCGQWASHYEARA